MATDYPPLDDHTIVEDFVGASCSLQSILSRNLNWPPDIGYSPIPYHLVTRNTLHIQQSAIGDSLFGSAFSPTTLARSKPHAGPATTPLARCLPVPSYH